MDLERKEYENFNLHTIKTDRFKTISVLVSFKRELKKEEINYRNFLSDIIFESSSKYKTRRELQIAKEDLYDVSLQSANYKSGNYTFIAYNISFLNEKYTEEGMNEKSIRFLMDLILNPDIEDNKFRGASFHYVKEGIKNYLVSLEENPNAIASIRLDEIMGKDTPLEYKAAGYLETLDEVTEESLYNYYKDVIENDIIDIFVIGDIDRDKIEELFKNIHIRDSKNKKSKSHLVELFKDEVKEIKEKKDFVQSRLQMGFKIHDLTDFERKYVLHAYNFILGGGNDSKLFREVREENSLCYHVSSSYSYIYGIIAIVAGIDKCNYEKTVELVKKAVKEMQDGDFKESDLEEVKKIYINACKRIYDSPFDMVQNCLVHEYFNHDFVDDRIKNIEKVTKEDIINIAKKIELDTIYLLEGGNSEA